MAYSYKGAISFGLVYIPVVLTNCIKQNDIGFNMIDKNTMSRIRYKKTCTDCGGKEIKNENIVKGYQYEKDKYVIFSDEDFEKMKTEKDKNITIENFINQNEMDPVYFDKTYFVVPTGGEKAYYLLVESMQKQKKVALAKTILGTKETLVMLSARNGICYASSLFFQDEILEVPSIKKTKVTKQELDLATTLIGQMTSSFNPQKYKDEYNEKVKKAIKAKIAGKQIIHTKDKGEPSKVINIMDALKKSIETNKPKGKMKNEAK